MTSIPLLRSHLRDWGKLVELFPRSSWKGRRFIDCIGMHPMTGEFTVLLDWLFAAA